nr:DUF6461 domain-containing protein [Motilibacter aurantiacus]
MLAAGVLVAAPASEAGLAPAPKERASSTATAKDYAGLFDEAGCVTFVTRTTAERTLRRLGGDPARRPLTRQQVFDSGHTAVLVRASGNRAVTFADDGLHCDRPETLRVLSRGGAAVAVSYPFEAEPYFSYWVDGRDVATVGVYLPWEAEKELQPLRRHLDGLLDREGGLRDVESALALGERLTGIRITAADITPGGWRVLHPPLPDLPKGPVTEHTRFSLTDDAAADAALRTRILALPAVEQRQLAAYAVQVALTGSGARRVPGAVAYAAELARPTPPRLPSALEAEVRRAVAESEAAWNRASYSSGRDETPVIRRGLALRALREASNADPALAVLEAVTTAGTCQSLARRPLAPAVEAVLTSLEST